MTKMEDEFRFISNITPLHTNQSKLILGIGDDAALYRTDEGVDQIVCMDTMVEGVHFTRKTMKPFDIGYKVLASNISDIAAMGGVPLFYLVSIAIPPTWDEKDLIQIYNGMNQMAAQFSVDLIGGDTVSISQNLVITVSVIGEVIKGKKLLRSHANDGDIVFVTGTIGDSGAGLEILLKNDIENPISYKKEVEYLLARHQRPMPRVDIAPLLTSFNRVALNDISDGLASELNEIADASHVTIVIEKEQIPISEELHQYAKERAIDFALYSGEDYELVGTISKQNWAALQVECKKKNIRVTAIGKVYQGDAKVHLSTIGQTVELEKKGYNHFKS